MAQYEKLINLSLLSEFLTKAKTIFAPKITASGILKGNGSGGVSAATAGTDYATPAQVNAKYTKPSTGIPDSDIVSAATWNAKLSSHQTIKQDGVIGATATRFGTCSTAASTAAKTVSITSGTFTLGAGARVTVKFSYANTANNPTLNVNSKGAKNIFHNGSQITTGSNIALLAGTVDFVYDGTQWQLIGNYLSSNYDSKTAASGGTELSLVTTGEKYTWNNKTSNTGTITGITMNGQSKGTSGVVNLGTVITDVSTKADKPSKVSKSAPTSLTLADNTEYTITGVTSLSFSYPSGDFECWIKLTTASSGTIRISFPTSSYVGLVPSFATGQTWEISIKNKIIVAGRLI